ncbi:17009_t:CDS:2 [Racocetra fulgida]|uniref:17009_t:CDS:1 n=1 Tax=Racocetra fulgida TaxID=60492 RepID=A0A9N9GFZ6_9GLOM|nr:17009_t:CDS:2 [Racocetra fulgida]
MTQIVAEMAWEEHLDNAEKIRKTVTANRITDSNNKITNDESIIRELVNDDDNENGNLEELTTTSYNTTNVQNCHPAEHEGSKIELQYLFKHALSQPSFVRTLQQDVENNFVFSNN